MDFPNLIIVQSGDIIYYTDLNLEQNQGVKIAFTTRHGGASSNEFASLNFGQYVGDNAKDIAINMRKLADCMEISPSNIIVPRQVHASDIVFVKKDGEDTVETLQRLASEGADAIVVCKDSVGALLCFADCVPVIIVSSSGNFAVVHAGWRGVMLDIVGKAFDLLKKQDAKDDNVMEDNFQYNFYIGPHIHKECFETSKEIHDEFVRAYGAECSHMGDHINLACAIGVSLLKRGVGKDRIANLNICTVCNDTDFFSYRTSGGKCGRHAAFAVRSY